MTRGGRESGAPYCPRGCPRPRRLSHCRPHRAARRHLQHDPTATRTARSRPAAPTRG